MLKDRHRGNDDNHHHGPLFLYLISILKKELSLPLWLSDQLGLSKEDGNVFLIDILFLLSARHLFPLFFTSLASLDRYASIRWAYNLIIPEQEKQRLIR